MPVVGEPADVTSRGVFQASFQPGADLPPQKYGTLPTSDNAVVRICFRMGLQFCALTKAINSASVKGTICPLPNVPYSVIFKALAIF